MNTEAALVRARRASFWIEVFGGRVPRARREVSVRGRRRSWTEPVSWGALDVLGVGDAIMSHREETVSVKRCVLLSKSDSELTSMPVPSASPFVLVLCGFELGDVS